MEPFRPRHQTGLISNLTAVSIYFKMQANTNEVICLPSPLRPERWSNLCDKTLSSFPLKQSDDA